MNSDHFMAGDMVLGHDMAKSQFLASIKSDRLHHAWLVVGNKGIGKKSLVNDFIRILLQQENISTDTKPLEHQNHPDIMLLTSERAESGEERDKHIIPVDEVRKLKNFLQLTPAQGKFRIAVIDNAQHMNHQASNALLKILEEPNQYTIIFLICHSLGQIITTVRSRCRILRCHPLSFDNFLLILHRLDSKIPPDTVKELYEISGGNVSLGLRIYKSGIDNLLDSLKSILYPNWDRNNMWKIAEFAADDKYNWEMITSIILTILRKQIKESALNNSSNVNSLLKNMEEVENMFYNCSLHNLDKQNVIISVLNSIHDSQYKKS